MVCALNSLRTEWFAHQMVCTPIGLHTEWFAHQMVRAPLANGSRTACKWFANQMRVCVDGTVNLLCAIREWFAYHLLRTKICQFFARTQRELDAQGVLSLHRVSFARLRFTEN